MNKQNFLIIYIGRFRPFHIAHQETLRRADLLASNVLVLIGSSRSPRTIKNPWTTTESEQMIKNSTHIMNLHIRHIRDFTYDDNAWIQHVGQTVQEVADSCNAKSIAVIGHDKDHSSFYLNYFPQWKFESVGQIPSSGETIDSTKIRDLLFNGNYSFVKGVLPFEVYDKITRKDMNTDWFSILLKEYKFVESYKKIWSMAPYPPTFVTVDSIVIQSGHILLIKRGEFPGNGMWAMPGGFLDQSEKLDNAVIRELREETKLKVPEKVLKGSIVDKEVFDDPGRSTRGRTITHAYLIKLDDSEDLPKVKGSDDASHAEWVPLHELENMEPEMYEDHWHIIKHMLNRN